MELFEIVDSLEELKSVSSYSLSELPNHLAAIELEFQTFTCCICIVKKTDEILLVEGSLTDDLMNTAISSVFNECIGARLAWAWKITNNQGYSDALRFEFNNGRIIELVVIASSIRQYLVKEF